jgi:tetratricopeptide (TPR) repeat protein
MICSNRASDIVGSEQHPHNQNGSRRKGTSAHGENEGLHSQHHNGSPNSGSRSCLVLPPYLTGNSAVTKQQRRRQRQERLRENYGGLALSPSDSTDHSSNSQASQNANDRASLLAPKSSIRQDQRLLWATPEEEDEDGSNDQEQEDPFHVGTPSHHKNNATAHKVTPIISATGTSSSSSFSSPSRITPNGPVTPSPFGDGGGGSISTGGSSARSGSNIGLLSFPTPQDRGHKKRLQFEKVSRKKPVYNGELEPEGVRGEEASWTPATAASTPSAVPLRSFGPGSSSSSKNSHNIISTSTMISPSPVRLTIQPASPDRSTTTSASQRSTATATTDNTTPNRSERLRRKMNKPSVTIKAWQSSDISTTSSQDIEQMMSDFVLEKETGKEQDHFILAPSGGRLGSAPGNNQSTTPSTVSPIHRHLFESMTPAVSSSHRPATSTPPRSRSRSSAPTTPPRDLEQQQQHQQDHQSSHSSSYAPSSPLSTKTTEDVYRELDDHPATSADGDDSAHHEQQQQHQTSYQMDSNSQLKRATPSTPSLAVTRTPSHLPPPSAQVAPMSLFSAAAASGVALSAPVASVYPPPEPRPSSPDRSKGSDTSEPTAGTDSTPGYFRKSAPVDVDDSSFIDPMANVEGINAMAIEHVMKGEYDMALHAFGEVLQVYQKQFGKEGDSRDKVVPHPLIASTYHNLGTVHSKRAMLFLENSLAQRTCRDQALLCFQGAARAARDSLGPTHPNVSVSLVRIGFLLLQARQYHNAVKTFQESLRIRIAHYGGGASEQGLPRKPHCLIANVYNNLGVCHMHLEEFDVGRRYLDQAVRMQQELMRNASGVSGEAFRTQLLELADTQCNIGGLCLEWIRKQGPDARHAMDAESAFLEALEVSGALGMPLLGLCRFLVHLFPHHGIVLFAFKNSDSIQNSGTQ